MKKLIGDKATQYESDVENISERLSARKSKSHNVFRTGQPAIEQTLMGKVFKDARTKAEQEEQHGKVKVLVKDGVVVPQV